MENRVADADKKIARARMILNRMLAERECRKKDPQNHAMAHAMAQDVLQDNTLVMDCVSSETDQQETDNHNIIADV